MAIDPTNYINTWNNSSVLQQQFPDVNDYVALFGSSYTPFTSSTSSTPSTSSESGVGSLMQPKIIDDFNDSGDQGNPPGGNTNAGYGYSGVDGFSLGDIGEGTVDKDDYTFGMQVNDAVRGAKTTLSGLPDRVKDYVKSGGLLGLGVKGVGKVFNYGRNVLSQGLQSLRDKQAEEKALADAMAVAQAEIDRMGYKDYGQGAATGGGGYNDGDGGSYSGASTQDYSGGEKDGGFIDGTNRRIGFAEGGSYWQTVQEAYDSAGGQDGTGLGFFDFADMYFPNPMATGGIVSLAGGGGVGMPPIAYPIIDTPDENLTAGVSQNKNPFISYTKQFDAFGGEGGMGVYKERGQDPSFGMHYRKQFEPGGGINSLFRKK